MALIHCDFFSEVLGLSTSMYVILPQATKGQIGMAAKAGGRKHPTLYLLHGLSDDHSIWLRRTSIERYVAPLGLAVLMPAAGRSFYTDMATGGKYWTFVSEELPEIARSFFGLSDQREDNFAAGLSMGGYGAFKLALAKPEKFCAAASLSGVVDIANQLFDIRAEAPNIFGDLDKLPGSFNDLFFLARELVKSGKPLPKLYQWCGTEDLFYEGNIRFQKYAKELKLDLTYEESPGDHQWLYWDRQIQRVLEWLPLT